MTAATQSSVRETAEPPATVLDAALWMAVELGAYVFPVDHPDLPTCAGVKTRDHDPATCTKRGKHPACGNFTIEATNTARDIVAQLAGATRNYGIVTRKSRLLVLDVDEPGALDRYLHDHGGDLPTTFQVRTGRGRHLYFRVPLDARIGNRDLCPGVNVRAGRNGYVVGPGSQHADGHRYEATWDRRPAPAPQWLVDALTVPAPDHETGPARAEPLDGRELPAELVAKLREPAAAGTVDRSEVFHSLVADLKAAGFSRGQAVTVLTPWCEKAGKFLGRVGVEVARSWPKIDSKRRTLDETADEGYWSAVMADGDRRGRHESTIAERVQARKVQLYVEARAREEFAAERNQVEADDPASTEAAATELDAFLGEPEPEYDWLIPGLLERTDRIILTGGEGLGKSTLLRQVAVQAAAGIHPFTLDDIAPLRTLIVDLENSRTQSRRKLRPLRAAAGDRYKPEPGMHLRVRPDGIDLLGDTDGRWLLGLARQLRPDILITGPIYKLAGGDPTEERTAKAASDWLDRIRTDVGCAILLEAHSPHATGGGKRPERPYGASLWLRWPEFGIYLAPDGGLRHWRGARDERDWPPALQRGGAWPWTVADRERDRLWATIVAHCTERGERVSLRALAAACAVSVASVRRAVAEHGAEWEALAYPQVIGGGTP